MGQGDQVDGPPVQLREGLARVRLLDIAADSVVAVGQLVVIVLMGIAISRSTRGGGCYRLARLLELQPTNEQRELGEPG